MVQPLKMNDGNTPKEPLEIVVDFLEKRDKDDLASLVIDEFEKISTNIEQINLLAKLYLDVRNIPKAEALALRVLAMAINPQEMYSARANLAKLYNNINEPSKSLFYSNINYSITPKDPDVLLEQVFSLYLLGRKADAETILRSMKDREGELEEHHADIVNFNLGTYDLEQGKFIEGLKGFMLKGRKLNIWFSPRKLPFEFWEGQEVEPGRHLILFAEGGGIGDEMWAVRFMDDLKERGFIPIYYTSRPDLYTLFNRCGYTTIMNLEGIPKNALWTYFMQVPIYLNSNPDKVCRGKYLFPSDNSSDKWANIVKNTSSKKLKIGVRWQGNAKNERDLHRKVPLDDIMKTIGSVFSTEEIDIYSLQIGDGVEELDKYPEIIDISEHIKSYDDTLALLSNLDFVITSCTSVLHASAIVGTDTYAMIPISAYFTWVSPPTEGRPNNSSIWYEDNLKLFKQIEPKNWDKPFEDLKLQLQNKFK